jgi:cytochrome P450
MSGVELHDYPAQRDVACPFEPPPEYTASLPQRPVIEVTLWNGAHAWLVTGYQEGRLILGHPGVSSRPDLPGYPHVSPARAGYRTSSLQTFNNKDNPQHNVERRMFTKWFTVRRINSMRARIEQIVDDALDSLARDGSPADLVERFAVPVPSQVIFSMLNASYDHHSWIQHKTNAMLSWRSSQEESLAAAGELLDFCQALLAERAANLREDDMLSAAIREHVSTGLCTLEQLAEATRLLFAAGHETTANSIALGTLALIDNPEQRRLIEKNTDPEFIANAVDEILRFVSIAQSGRCRVAMDDIEIADQKIKAGDGIVVSSEAANRDGRIFDCPEILDLSRSNAKEHAGFGHGTHRCLGETLAEAELQIVFKALFTRFKGLRVAVDRGQLRFKSDHTVYGLYEFPVAWDAA